MADTDYFAVQQAAPNSSTVNVTLGSTTTAVHFWTADTATSLNVGGITVVLEAQRVEDLYDPNLGGAILSFTKATGSSTVYILEELGVR